MKSDKILNKAELFQVLNKNTEFIAGFGVERLGVFGSFVTNEVTKESDVDFFVDFHPGQKTFDNFMNLAFLLEEICGRKIELVTEKSLDKYIGPKILDTVEYVFTS